MYEQTQLQSGHKAKRGGKFHQLPEVRIVTNSFTFTLVHLKGRLKPGVYGKDVIITLCGLFNKDQVLNHSVEFVGEGVYTLSIDERLTIANMTTEWGTLAGIFPVDEKTLDWFQARSIRAQKLAKESPDDVVAKGRAERFSQERYTIPNNFLKIVEFPN